MRNVTSVIPGPTFEEMLHPEAAPDHLRKKAMEAREKDPLDPINLFNITWRDPDGGIRHQVVPGELTGVEAPIVVLYARDFPTGSHKVGAAYSVLMEKELFREVDPKRHTLVWPSTGNYGIGGAWVGGRMGCESIVILPARMSQERFQLIEKYGAKVIKTPGSESNVKEIYDKTRELSAQDPDRIRILNQFEVMGNYRFHYYVTGNTIVELAGDLKKRGIGNGRVAAFVSAMGSAGTIAAGDRLKQAFPDHRIIGLEPVQCPTLYYNGFGSHGIQGIGDKHVTWIHHVTNMDALMCVDDQECLEGLQFLTEEPGWEAMRKVRIPDATIKKLSTIFGISGVCNLLGAIKAARHYGLSSKDLIVTVCTDAIDRYGSVMDQMTSQNGKMEKEEARARLSRIFHHQKTDWIKEGTRENRRQWHNLKYFTWVEQLGKSVEELDAQLSEEWWAAHQAKVVEIDRVLRQSREA